MVAKMKWTTRLAVTLVMTLQGVLLAVIPHEITTEEDIRKNLNEYESNLVDGFMPPLLEADNHFKLQSVKPVEGFENLYVVEIHKKQISIKTAGLPSQKILLNETEAKGIQKLSLSFIELLNSSKLLSQALEVETETMERSELNPVIILSNFGISVQFLNDTQEEPNATKISSENRRILWDFLTKYARNIFEEKLKDLNLSGKYAEVFDIPLDQAGSFAFQNFMDFLWSIMRLSVDYAETAFDGWTTNQPEITASEAEKKYQTSTATLFAYEEPSSFREFPSQEFQYRRKDTAALFYGRGVI